MAGDARSSDTYGMMALFMVGAIVMRGAGCVVNDLWDRDLDAQVARTKDRPLASGVVKPAQAILFLTFLGLIGLVVLLQLPVMAIVIGCASLPFIIAYPLMKRMTWWPQLFLGLTFNFGAVIGWAAMTGGLDWPALGLFAAGIAWTLSYDTVYACMDRNDDRAVGIKSTALRLGDHTKKWVAIFAIFAFALLALTLVIAQSAWWIIGLLIIPFCIDLRWIWRWDPDNHAACLRLFKRQRDIGLMIVAILILYAL